MAPSPQALPEIIAAERIIPDTKRLIGRINDVRNAVAENISPSVACFENAIQPLIDVDNETQGELGVIYMLRYASPDQAARDASNEATSLLGKASSEFTARADLYLIVKAVREKAEKLEFEAAKYLQHLFQDFTRCGHGVLNGDEIKTYLDRRDEIDSLRRKYTRNIRDDDGGLWLSLEELGGVSEQDILFFHEGTEPETQGMRFVHFTRADLEIIMKFAKNPATRKKMYIANSRKLAQNVELFKEVILLRDENARLLGYDSHAAFKLKKRAAKNPAWVNNFLDHLEKFLVPQGLEEVKALMQKKRSYLEAINNSFQESADVMHPWDYDYYTRLALDTLHVEHVKISEYFPLQTTIPAMLEVFQSCLQLRFVPIPPEQMVEHRWHEDVEAWSVWDERKASNGEFVGYLYTDLLWRSGKHQGSQNVNLQCGYLKNDGSRVYPATILMCSFPRPSPTGCALLKHHEIVSLFHELGHGIHDLVSRTSYVAFHGHRAPPDFAEAPSVMLENWCWMKDDLRRMSNHYTKLDPKYLQKWKVDNPARDSPPDKIPDEILDSLVRSRDVNRASWFLRQLAFSRFDMAVHHPSSHEECADMNPAELYNNFMEKLRFLPLSAEDRGSPQADFMHLFSGYDAGYYSYLSAHVTAADIFQTTFAENPRSQAFWERYRRGILEYGGSRNELEMLEEFLGHSPSPEYLLRGLGVPE